MVHKFFEQIIYRSYILVGLLCILNVLLNANNHEKCDKYFDYILNIAYLIVFASIIYLTLVIFPVK